jgi:hypothetical protein
MSTNWLTRLKGNVAKGLKTVEAVNDAVVAVRRAKKNKKSTPAKQGKFHTAKSKAEIRHDKLATKAENAIQGGNFKKQERLVKKANKLNTRKNLGKDTLGVG